MFEIDQYETQLHKERPTSPEDLYSPDYNISKLHGNRTAFQYFSHSGAG
jgi:hypothetical protein